MIFLTDIAYTLLAIAIAPMVLWRMLRHGRYRTGWNHRLGQMPAVTGKPVIWIHAVSVGEVNATKTLISRLQHRLSSHQLIITSTTDTGYAQAVKLYSQNHKVLYFPLDFSLSISTALRKLKPDICILMELEVWPNLLRLCAKRKIPVIVANGRLSAKSFAAYSKFTRIIKPIFSKLTLVLAQSDEYARRFEQLGVCRQRVKTVGSIKYDTAQIVDKVPGTDMLARQLGHADQPLWVAGATGPAEEKIILQTYKKLLAQTSNLRLAIIPRKPERFNEVAALIRQMGFSLVRYSCFKSAQQDPEIDPKAVILGDTMGDLRKFYCLADVVFVGRSLVPMGGSDMAEVAALGKCAIFGTHTFNFNQTVEQLLKASAALQVQNAEQLLDITKKCLTEPDYANSIGRKGRQVIVQNQGATEKTVQQIQQLLG